MIKSFRKQLLMVAAAVVCSASALAAPAAQPLLSFSVLSTDPGFSGYSGSLFAADIDQPGFSFSLLGNASYGYELVLEVNGQFAAQTGLVGYAVSVSYDRDASWYTLNSIDGKQETYKLALDPQVGYTVALGSLPSATSGRQGLTFNAVSVPGVSPPVPEPGTYAMMLAGICTVTAFARRRAARSTLARV